MQLKITIFLDRLGWIGAAVVWELSWDWCWRCCWGWFDCFARSLQEHLPRVLKFPQSSQIAIKLIIVIYGSQKLFEDVLKWIVCRHSRMGQRRDSIQSAVARAGGLICVWPIFHGEHHINWRCWKVSLSSFAGCGIACCCWFSAMKRLWQQSLSSHNCVQHVNDCVHLWHSLWNSLLVFIG